MTTQAAMGMLFGRDSFLAGISHPETTGAVLSTARCVPGPRLGLAAKQRSKPMVRPLVSSAHAFREARSWYLVPCFALTYYQRFWFAYQGDWIEASGECPIFDYGWVWAEHGIVLLALGLEAIARRPSAPSHDHSGVFSGPASLG